MKNFYLCTLRHEETKQKEILFCNDRDLAKLLDNIDDDRYRIVEVQLVGPVSQDFLCYVKKDQKLELGNNV